MMVKPMTEMDSLTGNTKVPATNSSSDDIDLRVCWDQEDFIET